MVNKHKQKIFRKEDGMNIKIEKFSTGEIYVKEGYSKNKSTPFHKMNNYKVTAYPSKNPDKDFKKIVKMFAGIRRTN